MTIWDFDYIPQPELSWQDELRLLIAWERFKAECIGRRYQRRYLVLPSHQYRNEGNVHAFRRAEKIVGTILATAE